MKRRISTESWIAFIAGFYVSVAVFGIVSCVQYVIWIAVSEFGFSRYDIIYSGEGFLFGGASLFVGVRLLISGRRFLAPAIWYMVLCAALTLYRDGSLLLQISPSASALTSFILAFVAQIAVVCFLIYLRSRAAHEA